MKKQIVSLKDTSEGFVVEEKKGKKIYLVQEKLEANTPQQEKTYIITFNTKENLVQLKNAWDHYVTQQQLTIYFVNTHTNEKWHVQPYFHAKITENIHKSLDVLFASITEQ